MPTHRRAKSDPATNDPIPPVPPDIEARLAAIVSSSGDAMIELGLDGVIASWNEAAAKIFGYPASEIVGHPISRLAPPERAGEDEALLGRALLGQRILDHRTVRLRKDGTRAELSLIVAPVVSRNGDTTGVWLIARDFTDQKRTSDAAAQMSVAVEAAPNGMVMVDERGVIRMVNLQMERLFGYTRAEMVGQPIELLLPERYRAAHPAQREIYQRMPEVRAMGHGRDLFGRRKDGTEFPVEVGLNPARTPQGDFVLAAVIDITERKRMEAELENVHHELRRHADQLETTVADRTAHLQNTIKELEAVSYSLSHDLRGPIRTIQGFAQIILEDAAGRLSPQEQELLRKSISAANRLDHLIQDVLTYTRVSQQQVALNAIDLEKLVRQIIDERPEFQPPKAVVEIDSPLEPVRGHEASLTQVITNLLDNAVKFVAAGQQPRIRIRTEKHNDQTVNLWFEDNGIGIPPESVERLFAIFQRAHEEDRYSGTGIGLAIVRKAVERMGGTVRVESELGKGSRFCVQLPRAER